MRRLKATISYDGTNFAGYQVQPGERTVQLELEKVLSVMHKGQHSKSDSEWTYGCTCTCNRSGDSF